LPRRTVIEVWEDQGFAILPTPSTALAGPNAHAWNRQRHEQSSRRLTLLQRSLSWSDLNANLTKPSLPNDYDYTLNSGLIEGTGYLVW